MLTSCTGESCRFTTFFSLLLLSFQLFTFSSCGDLLLSNSCISGIGAVSSGIRACSNQVRSFITLSKCPGSFHTEPWSNSACASPSCASPSWL